MRRVSLLTLIANDSIAPALFAGVLITVGVSSPIFAKLAGLLPQMHDRGGKVIERHEEVAMATFGIIVCAVLLFFLWWRISRVNDIIASGARIKAKVMHVLHSRGGGRIDFEYAHDRQILKTSAVIQRNPHVATFHHGQTLEVVLDPANPARCFICQLYFV